MTACGVASKTRPIIMTAESVRATLAGRKTQTRRVIVPQPDQEYNLDPPVYRPEFCGWAHPIASTWDIEDGEAKLWRCPYGIPGDRLWVREKFITGWETDGDDVQYCDDAGNDLPKRVWFAADRDLDAWAMDDGPLVENIPWKPSIHMPRSLSRLTLEVVSIRVERVQEIGKADAISEGFEKQPCLPIDPRDWYRSEWHRINAKRAKGAYAWDKNPWVWVIEYKPLAA